MTESEKKPVRILIADDEYPIRKGLARWLRKAHDYEVDAVASGSEALDAVHQAKIGHYTAVLLDQGFNHGPDGLEVLVELKRLRPDLPVILTTGKELQIGVDALRRGAYSYLIKPFANEELVAMVEGLLQQNVALRQLSFTVREILEVPLCLIWVLDETREHFRIQAWNGQLDEDYRQNITLNYHDPDTQRFVRVGLPLALTDVANRETAKLYRHPSKAEARKWKSLLSSPMICQGRVVGILEVYSIGEIRRFSERDKRLIHGLASQAAAVVHNDLLHRRSQALAEINRLLSGTYDLQAMLDLILAKVLRLIGTDIGWLYLLDHEDNKLKVKAYRGLKETQVHKARKLGHGVTGWVAEHGEAQLVPDVTKDERYIAARRRDIRSEIVVPLKRENVVLGVLAAKSTYLEAFTEDDLAVLSTFATQAALAVEREKLTRHVQEVSRLSLGAHLDELADYVAGAVQDLTGLSVALWLVEEKRQMLHIVAHRGLRKAYARRASSSLEGSIMGVALQEKRLLWRRDIQAVPGESGFADLAETLRQGWHFLVCVPLLGQKGQPIGSLNLYDFRPQNCSGSLEALLWTFANQAAIAIENARLFEQLGTEKRERVEAIREIGFGITAGSSLDTILSDLLSRTLRLTREASVGEIWLLDEKSGKLSVQAARGDVEALASDEIGVGEGMVGLVAFSNVPYMTGDVDSDPHFVRRLAGTQSQLAVPLLRGEQLIGVLSIEHPQPHAFAEEDLLLLEAIASQVVIAIENARLFSELVSAYEELRDLDKRKSEFLSTVSHELRTPLTPIKSCLENLISGLYGPITDKQRDRIEIALSGVNDEARLVENLLDLVRIQECGVSLDLGMVSVSEVVQSILQVFEYDALEKKIDLKATTAANADLAIRLDRGKIKQVLSNLVHNALKFTPPEGKITISVAQDGEWIKVDVADTGVGIPESELERIFDRFYQVDSSLTRRVGGTGIGLNIAKEYVEMHSGRIWAESKLGEGAVFTFTLPKKER